jgi:ketosteroid isomerase-like protein
MDDRALGDWLDRYFAAWASNDPADVAALFAPDAVYAVSPFAEPWRGRDEIVARWTEGGGELLRHAYRVLAPGIAHWNVVVRLDGGPVIEQDGILLLAFDAAGRCTEHREWYAKREHPDAQR